MFFIEPIRVFCLSSPQNVTEGCVGVSSGIIAVNVASMGSRSREKTKMKGQSKSKARIRSRDRRDEDRDRSRDHPDQFTETLNPKFHINYNQLILIRNLDKIYILNFIM